MPSTSVRTGSQSYTKCSTLISKLHNCLFSFRDDRLSDESHTATERANERELLNATEQQHGTRNALVRIFEITVRIPNSCKTMLYNEGKKNTFTRQLDPCEERHTERIGRETQRRIACGMVALTWKRL